MHLAINMRNTIKATQVLECKFAPTGARLHYFRPFLSHFEEYIIPDEPIYSEDQLLLFEGCEKTPIIRKTTKPKGVFAEADNAGEGEKISTWILSLMMTSTMKQMSGVRFMGVEIRNELNIT